MVMGSEDGWVEPVVSAGLSAGLLVEAAGSVTGVSGSPQAPRHRQSIVSANISAIHFEKCFFIVFSS